MAAGVRRLHTALRKKQIVQAAQKIILKYGSEHVTIKRIAKEVGISEGDIYRHFKSKRDVLFLLVDYVADNLLADLDRPGEEVASPLETLGRILASHLQAIARRKGIGFQVVAEIISLGDKDLNQKIAGVIDRYTQRIKTILKQGMDAGEVREDVDLDTAALTFFSMVQGLANAWTLNGHNFNLVDRHESLWQLYRRGIAK